MNLIWFLTIASILSTSLGEFGQFPFGSPVSVSLTDILLSLTLGLFFVWKVAIKKEIFWPKEFKILVFFWSVAMLGLIFSGNLQGGLYLVRFIFYSSSFLLGFFLVKEKIIKPLDLVRVFCLTGLVFTILGFLQILLVPNFNQLALLGYDPHQNRLTSTFLDPNFAGAFLVITFFFNMILYFNSKRKEWLVIGMLMLIAVALTFSRSSYLMFFVVMVFLGILKNRKLLLLLIPLIIAILLIPQISERVTSIFAIDGSAQARIVSWQNGWLVFIKNPILGVGFDNLRQVFAKYNLLQTYSANGGNSGSGVDSSLIFVLSTTGFVGFFAYSFWWVRIIRAMPLIFGGIFIGLIVDSQFINSLFYPPIMLMIYLVSGSFIASRND